MGKVKKARQKFHAATNKESSQNNPKTSSVNLPLNPPSDNIFAGINISFDNLKKNLSDDTRSVRSYKSTKSELGTRVSKKDKLKLKHDILLHKIDSVRQFKKQQKERKKRKNIAIIGDTNALRDALPSLDSLLKNRDFKVSVPQPAKKKGVATQNKRKKSVVEGVKLYEKILKHKNQKDPLKLISELVKQRVQSGNI